MLNHQVPQQKISTQRHNVLPNLRDIVFRLILLMSGSLCGAEMPQVCCPYVSLDVTPKLRLLSREDLGRKKNSHGPMINRGKFWFVKNRLTERGSSSNAFRWPKTISAIDIHVLLMNPTLVDGRTG